MRLVPVLAAVLLSFGTAAKAATFVFNQDPFFGSNALTTPGRQIVGGETFIAFDISSDKFGLDPAVFGFTQLSFANDLAANVSPTGVNVIVVQDTGAPFAAGTAANLLAARITGTGPGFFIYFNTGLDLARLVYSTDLSDNQADLKVLARLTNINGPAGFAALPTITAANFEAVPEPSTVVTSAAGILLACVLRRRWRRR
jgi:hypothetical protein